MFTKRQDCAMHRKSTEPGSLTAHM